MGNTLFCFTSNRAVGLSVISLHAGPKSDNQACMHVHMIIVQTMCSNILLYLVTCGCLIRLQDCTVFATGFFVLTLITA